jgi:hypothetical protein
VLPGGRHLGKEVKQLAACMCQPNLMSSHADGDLETDLVVDNEMTQEGNLLKF